ncbi:hypothetical protein, partial [Acidiphilium multivorum]|uniref:hypothetical protein n=1 Tax=Acidiphilium multivorum TaxID=62140 RepID=UPI001F23CA5A
QGVCIQISENFSLAGGPVRFAHRGVSHWLFPHGSPGRPQGFLLDCEILVDHADTGIAISSHELTREALDVFTLLYQNLKNNPIEAGKSSHEDASLGYTQMSQ